MTAGREQDARETLRAAVDIVHNLCPACGGRGWTAESDHAPDCDGTEASCFAGCPVQVQVQCANEHHRLADWLRSVAALLPSPPATTGAGDEVEPTAGNVAILQRGITVLRMQRDEARAEALRDAADAWMVEGRAVIHNHARRDLTALQRIAQWMRDRAALADASPPATDGDATPPE